tara:strand:+ start:290 stop:487 length:198 start_codon:yes stop_codon:yes gene_type:complete
MSREFVRGVEYRLMRNRVSGTPPVDTAEKKKPDHVNEMPIPCSGFKTKMVICLKVVFVSSIKTND